MQDFLISLSTDHLYLVYLFVIFTACIEGPILALVFGVLIKLGYFPLIPIYLALMLGDLFGDTIWYLIGRHFGHPFVKKYGHFFSISVERILKVEKIFHKYQTSILIISKLTTGFGFAIVTLFTAGLVKVPFRYYIFLNFIGQFFWTALLLTVGYYFSHFYLAVDGVLGKMATVAGLIILIVAFLGFSKYVKHRLTEEK